MGRSRCSHLGLGYVAYRLSFTIRGIGAERAGDRQRADQFRTNGTFVFLGATGALTLLLLLGVAVLIAAR